MITLEINKELEIEKPIKITEITDLNILSDIGALTPFEFKGMEKIPQIFFNQIKKLTLFEPLNKEITNTEFPVRVKCTSPLRVFKELGIDYIGG